MSNTTLKEKTTNNQFCKLSNNKMFKSVIIAEREYLNELLSDILGKKIVIKTFLNSYLQPISLKTKDKYVDIFLETEEELIIHLELNSNNHKYTKERNLTYYASLYGSVVIKAGKGYKIDKEITHISLNVGKNKKGPLKETYYLRNEYGQIYSEIFKMIIINVAAYKRVWYDKNIKGNKEHICISALDATEEELEELSKNSEIVRRVRKIMWILNADGTYTIRDSEKEKRLIEIAIAEEKAEKKGEKNGIIKVVKEMLNNKEPIEKIMKYTNLTQEQILKIK